MNNFISKLSNKECLEYKNNYLPIFIIDKKLREHILSSAKKEGVVSKVYGNEFVYRILSIENNKVEKIRIYFTNDLNYTYKLIDMSMESYPLIRSDLYLEFLALINLVCTGEVMEVDKPVQWSGFIDEYYDKRLNFFELAELVSKWPGPMKEGFIKVFLNRKEEALSPFENLKLSSLLELIGPTKSTF